MKKRFTETHIIATIKQHASRGTVDDICGDLGISNDTFYNWRSKYGGLAVMNRPEFPETPFLVIDGREHVAVAVLAVPIVGHLDVAEDVLPCGVPIRVDPPPDPLPL